MLRFSGFFVANGPFFKGSEDIEAVGTGASAQGDVWGSGGAKRGRGIRRLASGEETVGDAKSSVSLALTGTGCAGKVLGGKAGGFACPGSERVTSADVGLGNDLKCTRGFFLRPAMAM